MHARRKFHAVADAPLLQDIHNPVRPIVNAAVLALYMSTCELPVSREDGVLFLTSNGDARFTFVSFLTSHITRREIVNCVYKISYYLTIFHLEELKSAT